MRHSAMPSKQGGYTAILGLLIAAAILSTMIVTWARLEDQRQRKQFAEIEANSFAQWGVGLRGIVAAIQANPALLPAGPQLGVDWLKAPTCGGLATNPATGHIPCEFTGSTMGPLYTTTITRNPATNFVEARTSFVVPAIGGDPQTRPIIAEEMAEAALRQQTSPLNGMFYQVWANVPINAVNAGNKALAPGPDAGRVLMLAQNAPSNDIWLRTDGTNMMLADLNAGGNSLVNVNHADLAGDIDVSGRARVEDGLQVTQGLAQFDRGVQTTDVMLTGINRTASQAIYDAEVRFGAAAYVVPKPDCTAVGTQPAIYAAIQSTGAPPPNPGNPSIPSDALFNSEVRVTDQGASWLVEPVSIGVSHGLQLAGFNLSLVRNYNQQNAPSMAVLILRKCR